MGLNAEARVWVPTPASPSPPRIPTTPRRARRIVLAVWAAVLLGASVLPFSRADAGPTVELTSPAAGSTLTDPVVVAATASADVVGVQLRLDGVELGPEILTSPYRMMWDVRTAYNGNHTLEAVARDAAGNRATSTALVTVWAVQQEGATAFAGKPLPIVRDRLGRIPRDYVWAGTPSSTVVNTGYLPYDRDPLSVHDLDWFRTYHPDWLVYKCDRVTPIQYFTDPLFVFDITNPAVREYQYGVFVRNYIKTGVDGIAIDNFSFHNYNGKCGVYDANGVWRQKYTGAFDDPQYVADAVAWLAWLAERVRAAGGLVAINLVEPLHPDLDRVTSKVDLVYFEGGGFINTTCRQAWTDEWWLRKFQVYRRLMLERAVVVQDEACDYMSQMTPELASWGVANFFLLRGDRSYFSITQSYAWRPHVEPDYDGPEFHLPLGEPLEEPQQRGVVWTRQYRNGLVIVNPSSVSHGIVELGVGAFHDVQGRVFTGDVTVPPATGLLLLFGRPPGAFADVPPDHWAREAIEILGVAGITSGCNEHSFCPDSPVTRAEMAVFLLRARHGFEFAPAAARGIFADVPVSYWAAAWIERLAEENLGAGCGVRLYCPDAVMTRAQMAVSLVRAISTPGSFPPAARGVFGDVPATHWAAAWIEELARVGITAGCGAGQYCPESPVSRAQMAVFLVTAFGLGP